jgi:hypothetical protein
VVEASFFFSSVSLFLFFYLYLENGKYVLCGAESICLKKEIICKIVKNKQEGRIQENKKKRKALS